MATLGRPNLTLQVNYTTDSILIIRVQYFFKVIRISLIYKIFEAYDHVGFFT
jgi:hypothetical protein